MKTSILTKVVISTLAIGCLLAAPRAVKLLADSSRDPVLQPLYSEQERTLVETIAQCMESGKVSSDAVPVVQLVPVDYQIDSDYVLRLEEQASEAATRLAVLVAASGDSIRSACEVVHRGGHVVLMRVPDAGNLWHKAFLPCGTGTVILDGGGRRVRNVYAGYLDAYTLLETINRRLI